MLDSTALCKQEKEKEKNNKKVIYRMDRSHALLIHQCELLVQKTKPIRGDAEEKEHRSRS
jgi:hypothetical protein